VQAGKLNDLVILDRNPLKVDSMAIKDIKMTPTAAGLTERHEPVDLARLRDWCLSTRQPPVSRWCGSTVDVHGAFD
jgi:hypothetical protein